MLASHFSSKSNSKTTTGYAVTICVKLGKPTLKVVSCYPCHSVGIIGHFDSSPLSHTILGHADSHQIGSSYCGNKDLRGGIRNKTSTGERIKRTLGLNVTWRKELNLTKDSVARGNCWHRDPPLKYRQTTRAHFWLLPSRRNLRNFSFKCTEMKTIRHTRFH